MTIFQTEEYFKAFDIPAQKYISKQNTTFYINVTANNITIYSTLLNIQGGGI